jgi:RNA polymerase sigma factor (sigma-70 family)
MAMTWLTEQFEQNRKHLRKVAQRILGSPAEAEDALQEAWLRTSRAETDAVENLKGWLTTAVARVCFDMLRARRSPPQEPAAAASHDTEAELLLADSIGPAMLIVLDTLEPAERVAFVLHDMFDLPFDEIARIVGRSSEATRQLASRARRRVQGGKAESAGDMERQRKVVDAFLRASKEGNFEALLEVLDPQVVARADTQSIQTAATHHWAELRSEIRGAREVAGIFNKRSRGAQAAMVDGQPGAAWTYANQLMAVWRFTVSGDRITEIELVMEPARLSTTAVT